MKIFVNGEEKNFEPNSTVQNLCDELSLNLKKIAIEKNMEIVPKKNFANEKLQEGDKLEIIQFVGGG